MGSGSIELTATNVAAQRDGTITTNSRAGADPFGRVSISEEDIPTLVLPYIKTAREGVSICGKILE